MWQYSPPAPGTDLLKEGITIPTLDDLVQDVIGTNHFLLSTVSEMANSRET